jgi:hypothetical protein
MPMKSKAQRRFLHANEPEVAKQFEKETPKGKKLPERVKKSGSVSHSKKK